MTSPRNKCSAVQIRAARRVELKPLLEQLGHRIQPLRDNNWRVCGLPKEIIIKKHYWSSPEDGTGGNAIDLLVQVMGMNFNEAMKKLEDFM
jgi:hypothetical protein